MPGPCIDATLIDAARLAVQSLKRAKLTVITAESCTAGLVSAALSQVDGASDVLHGSFVVYTKENKAKALGVDPALLDDKSSVCGDVADRMASGALARSPAAIGLAITGVLRPETDEDGNPVGLVYFAICRRPGSARVIRRKYDEDDPDALRHRVTLDALQILLSAAGDS